MTSATAVFVLPLELGRDGPRVAIKDSIDIAGCPTQLGSAVFKDAAPATRHAAVVQAVLDAGCRIVGKTNLHELAYGVTGINRWTGTPLNPRCPERVPGGSSSGSAVAVAAGLVDFAIGTDTGGSIRIPAACCGIYGLKPTYGRVSRDGVHPATSSLDCVGPFARDLEMLERAMALIDPTYVTAPLPRTLRVGSLDVAAEPAISAAVHRALAGANGNRELQRLHLKSFDASFAAGLTIISGENWASYRHIADSPALGADVRTRLLASREVTPAAMAAAENCRQLFAAEIDAALNEVDVLALPTLPDFPMLLAAAATSTSTAALRTTAFVRPFNLTGHPAISVPLDPDAPLPVGLQLVGRRGGDAALCAAARFIVAAHANSRLSRLGGLTETPA